MKKVIGAVLAASLVAGMAFADVAVTLNARLRSNMFHQLKVDGGNTTTALFDLDNTSYIKRTLQKADAAGTEESGCRSGKAPGRRADQARRGGKPVQGAG